MKKVLLFSMLSCVVSIPAYALPNPCDVWECLKMSDPAIATDGDETDQGQTPVLCHLLNYSVKSDDTGVDINSKFSCLLANGKRKIIGGGGSCIKGIGAGKCDK